MLQCSLEEIQCLFNTLILYHLEAFPYLVACMKSNHFPKTILHSKIQAYFWCQVAIPNALLFIRSMKNEAGIRQNFAYI